MEIFGLSVFDLSGTIIAIISVVFMVKKSMWYWYLSIVCNILWCILFLNNSIYISAGLQVTYILFSIYGITRWLLEKRNKQIPKYLEYTGGTIALLILLIAIVNTKFTNIYNFLELCAICLLVVANWLTAKKINSCWYFWMIGDAVFAVFLYNKAIYATFFTQIVFCILSVWGLWEWKSTERNSKIDSREVEIK